MNKGFLLIFVISAFVPFVYGYCSANESSIVNYDEIKDLPNQPNVLLIDVRSEKEVRDTGLIPTAIHIPMYLLLDVFSSTANKVEFSKRYGRKHPNTDDEIIFYCLLGIRAQKAMEIVCDQGYKKARFYKGSWTEWAQKEGLQSYDIMNYLPLD